MVSACVVETYQSTLLCINLHRINFSMGLVLQAGENRFQADAAAFGSAMSSINQSQVMMAAIKDYAKVCFVMKRATYPLMTYDKP